MKPSRGVKAPMPIMIRSLVSRLVRGTFFNPWAFLVSSRRASPSSRSGFSSELPCGETSLLIDQEFDSEAEPLIVGCFEFLLLLVNFKSVLALSTFVTVRVRRYCAVFPRVALGAHFAAL